MKAKEHINMLGYKVVDKVSKYKGVVTAINFDLYGCIQGLVRSEVGKDNKMDDGFWLDISRLKITSKKRVMPLPDFDKGYISEGRKGPEAKPIPR